jgi:hypothetical protein
MDYSYTRVHGYRRRGRRRRVVLAVLALGLLLFGGYSGGRQVWQRIHPTASADSHPADATQLGRLTKVPPSVTDDRAPQPAQSPLPAPSPSPPPGAILKVPYTVQAPFANWKVHEESCEEAALLMYHDFLQGDVRPDIPPAEADQQLRALKTWQVEKWGAERDLTVEKMGQLAQAYWGHKYQVITVSETSIKEEIAAGHPVIVPVMTHSLQNSHYGPKTVYHVLLIKGYSPTGVVTNDPGIAQGKDWFYSWSVILGAIDAQTPKMNQGRVGLVVSS